VESDQGTRLWASPALARMPETRGRGVGANVTGVSASDLLAVMPQKTRFRFIDEVAEVDDTHVVARYRFREDEFFYPGHFPDRPVTPGVILLEAMVQCGLVIQSLWFLAAEMGLEKARRYRMLFTGGELECLSLVCPGHSVIMRSELLAWRLHRIRARVKMTDAQGAPVAESVVSGMVVLWGADGEQVDMKHSKRRED